MCRMTKPGGLILITSAGYGFEEHGTSRTTPEDSPFTIDWDYYRNLGEKDFKCIDFSNWFVDYFFIHHKPSKDLFFLGVKKGGDVADSGSYIGHILDMHDIKNSYQHNSYSMCCKIFGGWVNSYYLITKAIKRNRRKIKSLIYKCLNRT